MYRYIILDPGFAAQNAAAVTALNNDLRTGWKVDAFSLVQITIGAGGNIVEVAAGGTPACMVNLR